MKNKINTLIITSIVVLLTLIALQVYIVYVANQFNKDAFLLEAKQSVAVLKNTAEIQSIDANWFKKLTK